MKKIIFFINDLGGGGAERALVNLANQLSEREFDVTIKVLFDTGINKIHLSPKIKYEFVFSKVFKGSSLLSKIIPAKLLYWFFIKENYDIEVAFLEGIATKIISGSTNKHSHKFAWVHTEFKSKKLFKTGFFTKKEAIQAYSKYNNVFSVSEEANNMYEFWSGLKSEIRRNYVEFKNLNDLPAEDDDDFPDTDNIHIVTVGRLIPVKGYERLLKVVSNLKSEFNFIIHILGEGEKRSQLEDLIDKKRLGSHVVLHGYIDPPYSLMKKCSFYICSSYREGYNTAVLESLLLGIPVLTTNCSGMNELLETGEMGLIVENSENALEEGIREFLSSESLRLQYKSNIKKRNLFEKYEKENETLINIFK
ncbi:glycosyltransferase [Solibacillus sp.]|uniref:glycosyltransferase n=1 Tax=Solibacillus sp. TaxID=1909654 RepID=UPI003314B050